MDHPHTAPPAYFDAVLEPHRSLGPRGFALLMAAIAAVSFAAGIAFLLAGAWPVMGFFGLDALLVYIAFTRNYRAGHMYERLYLTERMLAVERIGPGGRAQRWEFQPYWLRVELTEPHGRASRLALSSHGRTLDIGAFLAPGERAELAQALRQALHDLKRGAAPKRAPVPHDGDADAASAGAPAQPSPSTSNME